MAVFSSAVFNPAVFFTDGGATCLFNSDIFNTDIFNVCPIPGPDDGVVKTGTGGIDPGDGLRRRRGIFKPTGLLHLPKKEGRKEVSERVDESREIQAEIAERLAREFSEESATLARAPAPPVEEMSLREIDAEIGLLLRKKLLAEEEELMIMLLMVAASET